jgi:hypothetical protein
VNQLVSNPFSAPETQHDLSAGALVQVEQQRASQEVIASIQIAKMFPRNQVQAVDRIIQACSRVTLATSALYAYPRGGNVVTGPSIRMAEALAQNWGNLDFGIRELSQASGESTVEAFAWDKETNTRQTKIFQVPHIRWRSESKGGPIELKDPRDIYELIANQGARRMRACILGVIPGDVIDQAIKQCEVTLENAEGAPEETIKILIKKFKAMNVDVGMIEKRLGHRIDSVIAAEVITLRKIFTSIRDGMGKVSDFFDVPDGYQPIEGGGATKLNDTLKNPPSKKKTTKKKAVKKIKPTTSEEPPPPPQTEEPKDAQTTGDGPSYAEIAEMINKAKSSDDIDMAIDLTNSIGDLVQRQELIQLAEEKLNALESDANVGG